MRQKSFADVAFWLVPAFISSNYLIARAAATVVPPHILAFGRWGLVLALLFLWRGTSLWRHRATVRREAWQLLVLGALGMWICGAWVYLGGRSTSATNIGLIYAAAPVGIAIGGARLLGERLRARQVFAMGCALLGVLFVIFRGDPTAAVRLEFQKGDAFIVAATVSWVAYSLLLRRWNSRLPSADRLAATAAGGLVFLAPFAMLEWPQMGRPSGEAVQLIVLAALIPGLMAYLAYGYVQEELGVARTSLVLYLSPVYAAAAAWALLGEVPGWFHVVGAALILPAVAFTGSVRR